MIEVIFFGRGGQGAVTGAQILATAAILGGHFKDCSSFPSFGAERRGAPVEAYCRISDTKIWTRSAIYQADIAVILDETVLNQSVIAKLKQNYKLIVNTTKQPSEIHSLFDFSHKNGIIATADLLQICYKLGLLLESQPIVNTPILGAITKITEKVKLDDISKGIIEQFGSGKKADKNIEAAKIAAENTCAVNF
jgi:2-oxoacid:acceptor oxidoreductase gamma subunit (pyruvate/2-ketoisovalerate family)